MLPERSLNPLGEHLGRVRALHQADLTAGAGWVMRPDALAQKFPNAGREWPWQWVFPATRTYEDPDSGQVRRHHLHETVLQKAVREAVLAAGLSKRAGGPHAEALVRDPFAGSGVRHPDGPRTARAQGREHDEDRHARAEPRGSRGTEPVGRCADPTTVIGDLQGRLTICRYVSRVPGRSRSRTKPVDLVWRFGL